MAENRCQNPLSGSSREMVCIETNRVLDSCRDRDCFENVRVYLSSFGNDILERTNAIRAKTADILWCCISIDPIQFNRGFYSVNIRFYIKLCLEACVGGGRSQEIEGISVLEKRVILFGGESNVSIFKSSAGENDFCREPCLCSGEHNVPTAQVEVVSPVLLGTKILEHGCDCKPCCCCHCYEHEVPEHIARSFDAPICFDDYGEDSGKRYLTVSLGIFSVIRLVRAGQYLVQASECCIPEKECRPVEEDDPCSTFRTMPFPTGAFSCAGSIPVSERSPHCGCNS